MSCKFFHWKHSSSTSIHSISRHFIRWWWWLWTLTLLPTFLIFLMFTCPSRFFKSLKTGKGNSSFFWRSTTLAISPFLWRMQTLCLHIHPYGNLARQLLSSPRSLLPDKDSERLGHRSFVSEGENACDWSSQTVRTNISFLVFWTIIRDKLGKSADHSNPWGAWGSLNSLAQITQK